MKQQVVKPLCYIWVLGEYGGRGMCTPYICRV